MSQALFTLPHGEQWPHETKGRIGVRDSQHGGNVRPLRYTDSEPTFEQLFHIHRLPMVRLAVLLVDEQPLAEDVVQDAFANLHAHWGRLNDHHAAVGYLRRSVVNGARSALRRRRPARAYVPPFAPYAPSAESAAKLAAAPVVEQDALF
jgi:DNA-directed RNA polymerase specialized sigma24 family protein